MTEDSKRARRCGREREAVPEAGQERDIGGDPIGNSPALMEAAGDGAVDQGWDAALSPSLRRELLQAGQVRFDHVVGLGEIGRPGAGRRIRHPASERRGLLVSDVAAFVATVGGEEAMRQWCLLTLAGALGSRAVTSSCSWRLDREAGVLVHGPGPRSKLRGRPRHRPTERFLPRCALRAAGASGPGPSRDQVGRRFERYRRTPGTPWIAPGTLRRFVIGELYRRAPELFPDDVSAWLGVRPSRGWIRRKRWFRPNIPAVLRAMDALLRDIDRQAGGALLRAGGRATTHH